MDLEIMRSYLPRFWEALALTVKIGWQGVLLAFLLGLLCAGIVHLRLPVLSALVKGYVELFRSTPLLVQLFFLYFALPKVGIRISAPVCGSLGLGLLGGAYMAETFRSGLESVPSSQLESALSLGMTPAQTLRLVILPQAVRNILPALGNEFVTIIKESSIVSVISIADLMFRAKGIIAKTYNSLECLAVVAIIYFILTFLGGRLIALMERRMSYGRKK